MVNQIFIPGVARYADDVATSLSIQEPLVKAGYSPGLMLVTLGGRKGVTDEGIVKTSYENLRALAGQYGFAPIVVMLSNTPIGEIDFWNNTEAAAEHVERGVDFANGLPLDGRRTVTFHLNSLVSEKEFRSRDAGSWRNEYHRVIQPALKEVARYAFDRGVGVKVETVPVSEFGDIEDNDERTYRGMRLNQLRNPFYLTKHWGFEQLDSIGVGVCLDVCHSRTLRHHARNGEPIGVLHEADLEALINGDLIDDVRALAMLTQAPLVHLNDGDGIYSRDKDGKTTSVFREGVVLGQGDIGNLREIVDFLDRAGIPYVLEINEKREELKTRPNTRASIAYLLK